MKIKKYKNRLKVAIDSPAAAGAGTQAKLISKHYNLFYLDTGKIYRLIANIKLNQPSKYNYIYIEKKMANLTIKNLQDTANKNIPKNLLILFLFILCTVLAPKRAINVVIGIKIKKAGMFKNPILNGKFA